MKNYRINFQKKDYDTTCIAYRSGFNFERVMADFNAEMQGLDYEILSVVKQ